MVGESTVSLKILHPRRKHIIGTTNIKDRGKNSSDHAI